MQSTIKRSTSGLKLETLDKFSSIPIVESGINSGMRIYNRVKRTNRIVYWGLETSENFAFSMIESLRPGFKLLNGPLETLDSIGLKFLEHFEGECRFENAPHQLAVSILERMPNAFLPPQIIYWNTKEYVSDRVVKPVLKRADSFGDIVDGAIDKADYALDKYLPDKGTTNTNGLDTVDNPDEMKKKNHAVLTYRRSKRLSKKLKNKLSSRTAAEVKALKNDVHILIYAAELIATNPKEAYKRSKEMWAYFSANEPENQKRPETMEQLFVLVVR